MGLIFFISKDLYNLFNINWVSSFQESLAFKIFLFALQEKFKNNLQLCFELKQKVDIRARPQ